MAFAKTALRTVRGLNCRFFPAALAAMMFSICGVAQVPTDLTGAKFAPNCGAANAVQIFSDVLLASGQAGVDDMQVVSDPDVVLIGNQWWLIFASNPGPTRGIEPVAAYLPPGVSLSYTGVYPEDPNGWHLIGANATDTGQGVAIDGTVSPAGWDTVAAETPSIDVGPDGTVSVYYAGHNLGQTNFEIGLMSNVVNGVTIDGDPVPAMVATLPWEFADNLGAVLEQSVRWEPQLNKFVMYYTAGAWWDQPPTNDIAYAESTDGITWTNRQPLGFPVSYYNQDFVYNAQRNRYEMVVSNDPTGVGGGNGRDLVWLDAATTGTQFSDWQNPVTLLDHTSPGTPTWRDQGLLSPAVKYGNLPGEENRIYVFFHAYGSADPMSIGRFYCDAIDTMPGYTVTSGAPFMNLAPGAGATMPITVNPTNGFTGMVNFTVSGAPAGVTAVLQSASSSTGTTLNVAVAAGTPQGRYPITVTGTSGTLTRAATFTLNVSGLSQTITIQPFPTPPPGGINYTPGLQYTVTASASSGLPVSLSVGGNGTLSGNVLTVTGGGNIIVAANQAGNGTYSPAPQATATLVINPETQTVNVAPIPTQYVGGTLDLSKYVSATSGLLVGSFTDQSPTVCSNNGSVVSFAHVGQCIIIAIQFGNQFYAPAGAAVYITVNPGTPTISWTTPAPIPYGTPLGAAQLNATASTTGSFVYMPPSGSVPLGGAQTLGVQFSPTDTTDYTAATGQTSLQVLQQASATAMTLSAASITPLQTVALNATVSPTVAGSATPTGTVKFLDASTSPATQLGSAVNLVNGQAQLANVSLPSGPHTLYAAYSSDTNYLASASSSASTNLTVAAEDFTLVASGTGTISLHPGASGSATFAIAPVYDRYPASVTFSVAGLPAGATYSLSPTTLAPNTGAQTVTLNLTVPATSALERSGRAVPWTVALVLPLTLLRGRRRKVVPMLVLLLMLGAGALSLAGCGTSSSPPPSYSVTLTGTSGTVTHTATLSLTVQ
jgi:hypothetical protein